ncbi:4Fe-4S dicluster domain-containing protein [Coriobacteriales bacterium OH1046]|nr:4Fe-4S dicluster domain-containing protein [Coriobacteriales bacterium OH1046]
MARLTFKEELCKGCGLCVAACPKHILELSNTHLNQKGYAPVKLMKPEECIGCAACATMCPDCVITVER